jgi:hypothetical protein
MAINYTDLASVKLALHLSTTDSVDDTVLNALMTTASREVDQYCDRYFGQLGTLEDPQERLYRVRTRNLVLTDDIVEVVDVQVDYTGYAQTFTSLGADSVIPLPVNAMQQATPFPYTSLQTVPSTVLAMPPGWVKVIGVFGWPEVPRAVKDATLLQTLRLFKSRDVPLGLVGGADSLGVLRLPGGLHPDARMLLEPYRRMVAFA